MKIIPEESLNAIFAIESLRAGIPTRKSTRELPDLRKDIISTIKEDLGKFQNGEIPLGRLVWGQYGQGKTHLLTMVEHIALDMNFAVSRVSLSREVSCHNLFKFYTRVAPRIITPDSTAYGIHRILSKKEVKYLPDTPIQNFDRYIHPLPALIFETSLSTEGEEQHRFYSDLMGERAPKGEFNRIYRELKKTAPPKFDTFKQTDHATAYFGLLADVTKFCGYNGWVILIDEVELMGRLGKVARLKAYQNLNWLLNWSKEQKYPIYTLAAAANRLQDDIWFGKNDNDRDIMPELAQERFGEKEKEEIKSFFSKAISEQCLNVLPVTDEELAQLLDKVALLHNKAYSWQSEIPFNSLELIQRQGSQPVRTYIRAAIETLDMQYLYKDDIQLNTTKLIEQELTEDHDFFVENDKQD
ncbi:ATP-binding protein [bacterium]|nr:ATP-binding protein [bacterium]MBU2600279.1 ATP-binding protein [bacterium]